MTCCMSALRTGINFKVAPGGGCPSPHIKFLALLITSDIPNADPRTQDMEEAEATTQVQNVATVFPIQENTLYVPLNCRLISSRLPTFALQLKFYHRLSSMPRSDQHISDHHKAPDCVCKMTKHLSKTDIPNTFSSFFLPCVSVVTIIKF